LPWAWQGDDGQLGRLCIVISFVKDKDCVKIQGHGNIATKHKGYGWEDKLSEVFIIANTREDGDTCLEENDDQVYESKVLLDGGGQVLQDVRPFEHDKHKSHCLASPPQYWYYVEMPFNLLHNTHEWSLSGEFGVPRFKVNQLEETLVSQM
jgi:hypothetical protein